MTSTFMVTMGKMGFEGIGRNGQCLHAKMANLDLLALGVFATILSSFGVAILAGVFVPILSSFRVAILTGVFVILAAVF